MTTDPDSRLGLHRVHHESLTPASTPAVQVRRAWLVLAISSSIFAVVLVATIAAGFWIYRHATAPEIATLEIVSGGGALVRSPGDPDWRLVDSKTRLRERDQISTALGTVVWVTMFDGTTAEIAEDTIVTVRRMRSSRFLNRTKLIVLVVDRGAVYVGMAPRGEFTYSEIVVRSNDYEIVMSDERGTSQSGSYLVESIPSNGSDRSSVRVAVLRGQVDITGPNGEIALESNQQVIIDASGTIGPITNAIRELIVNGNFEQGWDGWVEFINRSPLSPEGFPTGVTIEMVQEQTLSGRATVVEFLRPSNAPNSATAGIRQRVGKTIRLQSSLQLEIDIKITDQQPPSSGTDLQQFPLIVEINYMDTSGQEIRWTHGYYILAESGATIPRDRATRLERDAWQRIVFDLRNLSPLPRQISSIVVYASGESYQTKVASISLTSAELIEPE